MKIPGLEAAILHRLPVMLLVACLVGPVRAQELTVTGQVKVLGQAGKTKHPSKSDVVVWLTPLTGSRAGRGTTSDQPGSRAVRIVQKQKQFIPHLLVVSVGAEVEFPNLDPFFHNVFSLFEGKRFDLGLYEAGSTRTVRFDHPGICYIFCNIHPQMAAVVLVLDTPYSGVSTAAGEIRIPGVPPGRYRLDVWSEKASPGELKAFSRVLTIAENATFLGSIQLSGRNQLVLQHRNKYGQEYDSPTPSSPLYEQP